MIDAELAEALNNSIDRLNAGGTIADCLRNYPVYAAQLRPLLEAGSLVRRAVPDIDTANRARDQQRFRFEQALNAVYPRRNLALIRLLRWAASIVLIMFLFASGATLLAENALPGDTLYGFKLWTESTRIILLPDEVGLQDAFALRRLDEARQLIQLRREAELTFTGTVEAVLEDGMIIAGLRIMTMPTDIALNARVEVTVLSTMQGTLIARQIRVIEAPAVQATPTITRTPFSRPTTTPPSSHTEPPVLRPTAATNQHPTSDSQTQNGGEIRPSETPRRGG